MQPFSCANLTSEVNLRGEKVGYTFRVEVFDGKMISSILRGVVEKRYFGKLNGIPKKILLEAAKEPEFTNSELSKSMGILPQNMSSYIEMLTDKGCIYLKRIEGQKHYHAINPQIKWSLLEEEKREQQITARSVPNTL